jgi:diguanylate cyclase (GGDEF)-like protein/PAS domain S-box-containing protein
MTKFDEDRVSGEATIDAFGAAIVIPSRTALGPSKPVPDLSSNGHRRGRPRLRAGADHPFDVLAVLDGRGRIRFLSPSSERVLGIDAAEAIGTQALRLFDDESVDRARVLFADLVTGRRLSVLLDVHTERADGSPVDLEMVAARRLEPNGGVVLSIRDVTATREASGNGPVPRVAPVAETRRTQSPAPAEPLAPARPSARAQPSVPAQPLAPARPSAPAAAVPEEREVDRWQSTVVESLAEGVMIVDRAGTVLQVNEAFEVMFEAPRVRVVGRLLTDLLRGARRLGVELADGDSTGGRLPRSPVARAMETGRRSVDAVYRVERPSRPTLWIRASAQPLLDDGQVAGVVASFNDITAVRQASHRLRKEERFSEVLLDTLDEGIVACDADGRITVFNPAARRLHGLADDDDPIGSLPTDGAFLRPDGSELPIDEHPLLRALSGEELRYLELLLESEDGTSCKVMVNGEALVDDAGRRLGAVVAIHDVTEQKLNEERLAELALHDPLTALANRTLLAERLQEAIDGLARRSLPAGASPDGTEPGVAVYLLDLDDFKEINDELGHDVGDEVLVAVGRRLSAIVRPSDTVARLGGDEFVVLCAVEHGEEEMERIGERISEALARPYRIEGRTLTVLASVGGVFADNPDTDPSKLLSRADDSMYGVKWSRRRQRRSMTD